MAPARPQRNKQDVVKDFRTGEILDAARRVIGAVGFSDASMERIALEAQVAKGTLYLYFANKEALLASAVRDGNEEVMSRMRNAAARARGSRAKLAGVVGALIEYAAQHQAFCQVLLERPGLTNGGSRVSDTLRDNFDQHLRFVAGVIARGARAGDLRHVDPRRAAQFLFELIRSALRERFRDGTAPDPGSDTEIIVDFFLHGVAAGEPE